MSTNYRQRIKDLEDSRLALIENVMKLRGENEALKERLARIDGQTKDIKAILAKTKPKIPAKVYPSLDDALRASRRALALSQERIAKKQDS